MNDYISYFSTFTANTIKFIMSENIVSFCGYDNCLEIKDGNFKVIVDPNCGGRIVKFGIGDSNILYVDPEEDGYLLSSGKPPKYNLSPCAGRCDIGPEMTTLPHPVLWLGSYRVEEHTPQTVVLKSEIDPVTGLQLTRTFQLDEKSKILKFSQKMKNYSSETVKYFHWSRTFATGGGIALAPVNTHSKYPKGYLMYGPGDVIYYMPQPEENVQIIDKVLAIRNCPSRAKFAMDLSDGWLAYISTDNLLFVKLFSVYDDRIYSEIAGNNLSIWYNKDIMCELEPIGPQECLKPFEESSFDEYWHLAPMNIKASVKENIETIKSVVNTLKKRIL